MKKIFISSIIILIIGTSLKAQVKIGLPTQNLTAVTIIDDDGTKGYYVKKGGKQVELPSTRLQVNYGMNLINADKAIDGGKLTLKTKEIEYLKYSGRVFIGLPKKNGKTEFSEIAMYNKKYVLVIVRGDGDIRFSVYDRVTKKYVKNSGTLGTDGAYLCQSNLRSNAKQMKISKSVVKSNIKHINKINLSQYFPKCTGLTQEMVNDIESGKCILEKYIYKNCDDSKDLYDSLY